METQQENQQQRTTAASANQTVGSDQSAGTSLSAPSFQLNSAGAEAQGAQASASTTWDSHTNRRIGGIHPAIQSYAYALVNRAQSDLGIKLRVTSGMRTFAEQDELYAKGRTTGGGKVTNARGGRSYHNYGLAVDVVEITDAGQANWNMDWAAIGALGESLGWEWGGNWSGFVDKPHFQMSFGLSTTQLRTMYTAQGGNFVNLDGRAAPEITENETETGGGQTTGGQTTPPAPGTMAITGSVGKGGQNEYNDTKVVQTLLNSSGASLRVDGDCGPITIAAIEAFQMAQFGWNDGRVDVNGKTWKALETNTSSQPLVYTVKRGDNLTKIAKQFNVSVTDILSANSDITNPNAISVGQKITIPSQNGGSTTTPAPSQENETPVNNGGNNDPAEGGQTSLIYGSKIDVSFGEKVVQICSELGINPNFLMAAMAFETGGSFDPAQKNFAGSGATGLIQFMPATARGLGTTTAELAQMTAVQQLDWVKLYFEPYSGRINTLEDLYMAILWPRGIGKSNDYVLWSRGERAYTMNSGLDSNNDGSVTKAEAAGKVRDKYDAGQEDRLVVNGGPQQDETTTTPNNGGNEVEPAESGGTETTTETETQTGGGMTTPSSANFSVTEFNSRDGVAVPEVYYANIQELMNNLEVLRSELGGNSIRVNSGYRSPAHNANVGGATNSQHKYGKASDIVVSNYTPSQVHSTIIRLINEGKMKQGGVGSYNTFTHYDIRGSRARW